MNDPRSTRRISTLCIAVALLLVPFASLHADSSKGEVTLIGQLASGELAGTFKLIEQESGESIALRGSADLAQHVSQAVRVTGLWGTDSTTGLKYLQVSKVEPVEA